MPVLVVGLVGELDEPRQGLLELPFLDDVAVEVDYYQAVPERDETNNILQVELPNVCDVVGPVCTPTPPPLPTPT